jgi:hypothetical protein
MQDKRDDWVAIKFEWLALIATEIHEWFPLAVATLLAGRYFNSKTHEAWMSADTLAADLDTDRRNVQRQGLNKLMSAGLLSCKGRGGHGARVHYWISDDVISEIRSILRKRWRATARQKNSSSWRATAPEERATARQSWRATTRQSPGVKSEKEKERVRAARDSLCPPDSFAEQVEGVLSGRSKRRQAKPSPQQATQRQRRRNEASDFPSDWKLGNEELSAAHRIAGWDFSKTEYEFDKFKADMLDQGATSHNWAKAWETRCYRGKDYETKQASQDRRPSAIESSVLGSADWLDEQKQKPTKH